MVDHGSPYLIAAYLRISSVAIAFYDWLETAPTAYRFYRENWEHRNFSISIVLFIAIRFISIFTLTISNVGFFYGKFTLQSCSRFYLLPPTFKVLQAMVSQAILGVRAFNLSRRSKRLGWFLLSVYFTVVVLQWVTTLYQRIPSLDALPRGNCRAFNQSGLLGAWIFYVIAIIYDVGITALSVFYLLKFKLVTKNTMMAQVTKMMMYDGLGYLLVLTGVNILNLLLYRTTAEIQTAGSSLAYSVSWIMSQRLLIHLYDASRERHEGSHADGLPISQNVGSARDDNRVIRDQSDNKHGVHFDRLKPTIEVHPSPSLIDPNHQQVVFHEEVGVQVRVERTTRRNRYTRTHELEDYSRRTRNNSTSEDTADIYCTTR